MRVKSIHVFFEKDGSLSQAGAAVEVPGLGAVEFKDALSAETAARIAAEALAVLRLRFQFPTAVGPDPLDAEEETHA